MCVRLQTSQWCSISNNGEKYKCVLGLGCRRQVSSSSVIVKTTGRAYTVYTVKHNSLGCRRHVSPLKLTGRAYNYTHSSTTIHSPFVERLCAGSFREVCFSFRQLLLHDRGDIGSGEYFLMFLIEGTHCFFVESVFQDDHAVSFQDL